jgi:NAD(P)-dependent dehydrogenase (short-subunit alcohol dehydrogenase family)
MTSPAAPLTGAIMLVTGATDGIGKQTAFELAQRGVKVIAHARTAERGAATLAELRQRAPGLDLETVTADLASLDQVRRMAAEVTARFPKLDALINNAGVMTVRRRVSSDGFELTFVVNHLAHFLLTNLLLDKLKAARAARVVTVSSNVHRSARLDFGDLQMTHGWSGYEAYAQSKLANVLFAYRLASLLEGTGVTSNALHPGVINTKLLREGFGGGGASVERGAATSIFLATNPSIAGTTGQYFDNLRPVRSSPLTYDIEMQRRLWEVSARLTGLENA